MPATDDRAWWRPHRTCGLITLLAGVLDMILALDTPECKASSSPLSAMRSRRNGPARPPRDATGGARHGSKRARGTPRGAAHPARMDGSSHSRQENQRRMTTMSGLPRPLS
ncbi:cell division protein FtsW [Actinomyces sp. oral taxon 180 str. F0310]|nr:cell division protein FtsW [Actinomyces sp. oral taxon 180 str. F0310]